MSRTTSKNGRSTTEKRKKLQAQIVELEARLRKARAEFEATEEFDVKDASALLELLVNRVESEGERLYLCRGKNRVAALVPADEADYLEKLEDRHWNQAADRAVQEQGTIALEEAKKELGL